MTQTKSNSNLVAIITMCFIFAMISFVTNMAAPFGTIWKNQYEWAGMTGNLMNFLAYLKEGNQSILQERPKEDPDRNKMYQAFEFYANGGFPILCKKLGVDFADKSKNDRYTILHNYYNMLVSNDLMDV